jgi:hypothetical protein
MNFRIFLALDFRPCHPKLCVYIMLVIPLCLSVHVNPYTVPLQHPTMCFLQLSCHPLYVLTACMPSHTVPPQRARHPFNIVTLQHACHPTLCLCISVHVIPQCVSTACMSSRTMSQNCMSFNDVPPQRACHPCKVVSLQRACNRRLCFYSVRVLPYCVSTL